MRLKAKSIFTVILLVITIFTLTACNGFTPNPTGEEKAIPVYQGMEVSETLSYLSANDSISPNIMRLSNIGVTRNLNTNPIDQDDPFGTLDDGTISEVVTTEFPVTQTEVADYYSEINKDIFITVKLSNPDNFVILSFTLNGVFYQSYQFQDGSDSENLILKVDTGTVSGVKEYTIDAIKYIDGTETKDATFAGERTITVGLKHNSEPSVLVSDEVVNATSILLTVNLSDSQALSTLNKIVLYDGESLVQIYDLSLGENNIVFDKLNISTLYQYAVISVYDLIDGNNSRLSLLEKKALYTDDIVSIDNVIPTQTSIGFGITVTDVDQVGSVSAIELFQGETLVEALTDLSVREFTGLLSNNEYTIKVTYTYDLNDGVGEKSLVISKDIKTLMKATPEVVIDNVVPTQDSVAFDITVTDTDEVGAITAIELYQGETLIESLSDLTLREFTGLLSNNAYTIKVTYTYDLNDGVGSQTLITSQAATTVAKSTPVVLIENIVPTQDSITFEINVTDVDQVGFITAIELYKGETLIEALSDLSVRTFSNLLSNNAYQIKVTYTYDLNDGLGEQELITTETVTTLAKATPEVVVDNVVPTQDSVAFDITVTDADEVGAITAIELYQGETLIEALTDLSSRTFSDLLSNNAYQIKVTYTYDLNDGVGSQTLTINQAATTLAKATPVVAIDNVVPTQTSIGFGITVTDVDQVGAVSAIELYQGETLVKALTDLSLRTFTDLLSNNEYTIKVTYTYDLNDGLGEQELITTETVTTHAKATPEVVVDNVVSTQDSLTFDITVTDTDEVGSITAIELYKGDELVESLTNLTLREFNGLLSNNEYTIKVTYTYDLNDGVGDKVVIATYDVTTKAKATPEVIVENVLASKTQVYFEIIVSDMDEVGPLTSIELYKGDELVETIIDFNLREFIGLLSNTEYKIKVTYTYDLNDSYGVQLYTVEKKFRTNLINGDGSQENPYQIESVADLDVLRQYSSSHYVLLNDIDLSGIEWKPISYFSGVFNGNGYQIKNMKITQFNRGVGFIAYNSGVIKNIGIVDFDINVIYEDHLFTGGLVGENVGEIVNTFATGNINASSILSGKSMVAWLNAGGLVGSNSNGYILNSYASVEINVENKYWAFVGGLTAENVGGTIQNSFSTGNIIFITSNAFRVGNLIGEQYGLISNSYRLISQTIIINESVYSGHDSTLSEVNVVETINREWISNELLWSEDIWDLSDIEHGIIVLKKTS